MCHTSRHIQTHIPFQGYKVVTAISAACKSAKTVKRASHKLPCEINSRRVKGGKGGASAGREKPPPPARAGHGAPPKTATKGSTTTMRKRRSRKEKLFGKPGFIMAVVVGIKGSILCSRGFFLAVNCCATRRLPHDQTLEQTFRSFRKGWRRLLDAVPSSPVMIWLFRQIVRGLVWEPTDDGDERVRGAKS